MQQTFYSEVFIGGVKSYTGRTGANTEVVVQLFWTDPVYDGYYFKETDLENGKPHFMKADRSSHLFYYSAGLGG